MTTWYFSEPAGATGEFPPEVAEASLWATKLIVFLR
jgi:hypothetical protein